MKLLLLFFLGFLLFASCRHEVKTSIEMEEDTTFVDTFPKATAIMWIDKRKWVPAEGILPLATAKAKVEIQESGKVNLKSFVKKQPGNVQRYIKYHLEIFRVQKIMMDSGFVHPGEQYVQLRYMPEKAKKFK